MSINVQMFSTIITANQLVRPDSCFQVFGTLLFKTLILIGDIEWNDGRVVHGLLEVESEPAAGVLHGLAPDRVEWFAVVQGVAEQAYEEAGDLGQSF